MLSRHLVSCRVAYCTEWQGPMLLNVPMRGDSAWLAFNIILQAAQRTPTSRISARPKKFPRFWLPIAESATLLGKRRAQGRIDGGKGTLPHERKQQGPPIYQKALVCRSTYF